MEQCITGLSLKNTQKQQNVEGKKIKPIITKGKTIQK